MFRFIPSLTGLVTRRSSPSLMLHRLASQSSKSGSHEEPRVRLHPGHQFTLEDIAQGIPNHRKGEIEQLYEFEKLEINNQPTTRDAYRHHTNQRRTVLVKKRTVPYRYSKDHSLYRTVPHKKICIPYRTAQKNLHTVPYRTVTARGLRYTVSRNTVPPTCSVFL